MENFSRLESEKLSITNATDIRVYKIAGMVTLIVDSGTAFFNKHGVPIFTLPSHIDVNKVISVTNINQGNWGEYCNLDIKAKTLRVGALGNGKTYPLNQLQVIVAYLA